MPPLGKPRQERFAQELAKGKPASAAYVAAGYKESRPAASRLSTNVNVMKRVAELQERAADRTLVTVEKLTDELEQARMLAMSSQTAAAAVSAIMGKAKLHGLDVNKHDIKAQVSMTHEQALDLLA